MNYKFIKSLLIIVIFMITIIMQTYGRSIQSTRKFRVQPLAGEPERNDISVDPLEKTLKARLCHL